MEQNAPLAPKVDNANVFAGLAYLLGPIGIIFALMDQGKEDAWLRYHAWQAFFLGIVSWVCAFLSWTIILGIIGLLVWVMQIVYAIMAFQGKSFDVPVLAGWAKSQAFK
jgi:uncharacterized membrane protein